jgi:tetratricopeptide (TPR) repeat protein
MFRYRNLVSLVCFLFLALLAWRPAETVLFPANKGFSGNFSAAPGDPREKLIYHNNVGIAYLEQYNFREALGEFNQCLQIDSRFVPAMVNSAIAYYYLQDSDNSGLVVEFLNKALAIEPNQPNALFVWGMYCRNHNMSAEAREAFGKVMETDPLDVSTLYQMGQLALDEQKFDLAEKCFSKVVELSPYDTGARYSLAKTLIRAGKNAEGSKVMERFMELKAKGGISSSGTQYGQQGRYMMGVGEYPDIQKRFPAVAFKQTLVKPVRFLEATAVAGIRFQHGAAPDADWLSGPFPASAAAGDSAKRNIVAAMGSGAAFCDYDRDGLLDLVLVNCSSNSSGGSSALYHNLGHGRFEDVTDRSGLHFGGLGMGSYWIDFNNDGWPDLLLTGYHKLALYQNKGDGIFTDVTAAAGLNCEAHWHLSASIVDYDHDGSLDIFVSNYADPVKLPAGVVSLHFPEDFPGQGCHLYHNNGNGTFNDVAEAAKLFRPFEKISSVINSDFDNRRDIDFWMADGESGLHLFSNERVGTFQDWDLGSLNQLGAFSLAVADYNLDDWMDLAILQRNGKVILLKNPGTGKFSPEYLPRPEVAVPEAGLGWTILFFDYNNDGKPDLFILCGASNSGSAKQAGPELWENQGDGTFRDVTALTGLDALHGKAYRSATAGDYDNDGDVDLLLTVNGSAPVLLRNEGGNQNNWIKIRPEGTNSSRMGLGTKVEVKAGRVWQKVEISGGGGYLAQSPAEVIFGLGQQLGVDALRILWPKGVLQAEANLPINQAKMVKELDRKGTSCPLLYTWNGERYRFVTDFLGGCGIGFLEGPGRYSIPDTDEYVKISGPMLQARDGKYSLKINNQLEEVLYIDQTDLLVLDHPAHVDLYPNERLMPSPPYPEFRIYAARDPRPPRAAWGNQKQDVLPLLRDVDRSYPRDFQLLPYKGYAEEHELVLDLGDLAQARKISLLMTAWIDYADSTANYAATQAGIVQIPPYLQVKDEQGKWQTVIPSMGFPAGLPKTMVVDLSGKFIASDYHVRIVTNMRIYWDQILVNDFNGDVPVRQYRLTPLKADLHYVGFPREFSPDGMMPRIYDYDWIDPVAPWKNHTGSYTRFGDVTPLLQSKDDMYVIMCNGDEIQIDYDSSRLTPLPPGWTRSFFFYADGFGKDMDLHSTVPGTVNPLPFHGMSSYPYPPMENYPDTPEHQEYLRKYNTRTYQTPFSGLGFSGGQPLPE